MKITSQECRTTRRRGSVLVTALVVIMLLSLSVYQFSEMSLVEYELAGHRNTLLASAEAATSGIIAVGFEAEHHRLSSELLANAIVISGDSVRPTSFRIVPDLTALASRSTDVRRTSGVLNESALLNLNTLPLDESERRETRDRLTQIPGISREIADSILDWMDPDDTPSEFGAESSWYLNQKFNRLPRQARLTHLEELLQIRGITPELFFGEDRNGNGLPDGGDVDLNGNGRIDRGLQDYLTVTSCESALRDDGSLKLNLNEKNLAQVYDQLSDRFGPIVARFIVALRSAGPQKNYTQQEVLSAQEDDRKKRQETVQDRLRRQLSGSGDQFRQNEAAAARGGISLSENPPYQIRSLFDLIGVTVRIPVDGVDTLLHSPWTADSSGVESAFRTLESEVTFDDSPLIFGRINVLQAPAEVLASVPGISPSAAISIVRARQRFLKAESGHTRHISPAWLVTDGLFSLEDIRTAGPYLTTGGDVVHGISLGYVADATYGAGIWFQVDASMPPARFTEFRHLPPIPVHRFPHVFQSTTSRPDNPLQRL